MLSSGVVQTALRQRRLQWGCLQLHGRATQRVPGPAPWHFQLKGSRQGERALGCWRATAGQTGDYWSRQPGTGHEENSGSMLCWAKKAHMVLLHNFGRNLFYLGSKGASCKVWIGNFFFICFCYKGEICINPWLIHLPPIDFLKERCLSGQTCKLKQCLAPNSENKAR